MSRRKSAAICLLCVCLVGAAALGAPAPSAAPKPGVAPFVPLPSPEGVPHPCRRSTLIPVPIRPWLPPARVLEQPRAMQSDGRYALVQRPEVDLPLLAFEAPPAPPAPALIPGVLAHALLPDPTRLPPVPDEPQADPARAHAEFDPTADESRRCLLTVSPELRQAAAPFFRLVVPDPFRMLTCLRMPQHPPDSDPPAWAPEMPPPRLPVDNSLRR